MISRGTWRRGKPFRKYGGEIPIYGIDCREIARVFFHNGEQFDNATIMVTAVNACKEVNEQNPQAVAESIVEAFKVLKKIYARQMIAGGRVVERGMPSGEEVLEIQAVLAKANRRER